MTIEEAIKQLQLNKPSAYSELRNAIDIAIEALEKQIPKKPDFEGDGYWNGQLVYDTWICPNCEKRYELDFEEYDHCPNCGKAIDWKVEE